jgi:hypothetical protein
MRSLDGMSQGGEALWAFPVLAVEEVENLTVPGEPGHDIGKAGFPCSDLLGVVDDDLVLLVCRVRAQGFPHTGRTMVQIPVQASDAGGEEASARPTASLVF